MRACVPCARMCCMYRVLACEQTREQKWDLMSKFHPLAEESPHGVQIVTLKEWVIRSWPYEWLEYTGKNKKIHHCGLRHSGGLVDLSQCERCILRGVRGCGTTKKQLGEKWISDSKKKLHRSGEEQEGGLSHTRHPCIFKFARCVCVCVWGGWLLKQETCCVWGVYSWGWT